MIKLINKMKTFDVTSISKIIFIYPDLNDKDVFLKRITINILIKLFLI